jgi:hypothetical protein
MKRTIQLLLGFLFLVNPFIADAQSYIWARSTESLLNYHQAKSIAVDDSGNVYAAGNYFEFISFKDTSLQTKTWNPFLTKYNSRGEILWVKSVKSVEDQPQAYVKDIYCDSKGFVYLTGYYYGKVHLGNFALTGGYNLGSCFIAKCDSKGNFLWVSDVEGGVELEPYQVRQVVGCGISGDNKGNVFVTGYFAGRVSFDNYSITSSGSRDIFVAKYNENGIVQWVSKAGGLFEDTGNDITVDSLGNSYVIGSCGYSSRGRVNTEALFDTISISVSYLGDCFIAKYNPLGKVVWVKYTTSGDVHGNEIAFDGHKNLYVCGTFYYTVRFDNIPLSKPKDNSFICRYDTDGQIDWAKQTNVKHIASDHTSHVYLFSSENMVEKWDSTGKPVWESQKVGQEEVYPASICVNNKGTLYLLADYNGKLDLGKNHLLSKYYKSGMFISAVSDSTFVNGNSNLIKGSIFHDRNKDCNRDADEEYMKDVWVEALPGPYYAKTDENGHYSLKLDTGTYSIREVEPFSIYSKNVQSCPLTDYRLVLNKTAIDTSGFDFANNHQSCSLLKVDLKDNEYDYLRSSSFVCYSNLTVLKYCNYGALPEKDIHIILKYPKNVQIVQSSIPWVSKSDSTVNFFIPELQPFTCGEIRINEDIPCDELSHYDLYPSLPYRASILKTGNCGVDTLFNNATMYKSISLVIGIPENDKVTSSKLLVYPNPFNDRLSFRFNSISEETNLKLLIIDGSGKKISEEEFSVNSDTTSFDYENASLNQGIYHYIIEKDGEIIGSGNVVKF